MEEEELFEEVSQMLAFLRQLQTCSGVLMFAFATGASTMFVFYQPYTHLALVHPTIAKYAENVEVFVSVMLAGFITHFFGRKKTIIGTLLLNAVTVLVAAASNNQIVHYCCAIAKKFCTDLLSPVRYLYVAEVSQARFRAFFIGIDFFVFHVGTLLAYRFLSNTETTAIYLSLVLELPALGLTFLAPETPHYLAMTDRADQAEQVIQRLWADTEDYEAEALLEKAEQYSEERREGIFSTLMSSRFATPLFLCCSYTLANYAICKLFYNMANDYANYHHYMYWELLLYTYYAGVPLQTIISLGFQILGLFIYLPLCLVIGRRTLFHVSLLFSFSYAFMTVLAKLGLHVLVLVYSCKMCEYLGINQIAKTLPTEIFPAVTRDVGVGLVHLIQVMHRHMAGYVLLPKEQFGWRMIVGYVLAIGFPLGAILVYLFMPETKDLPLTVTEELGERLIFRHEGTRLEPDLANEEESIPEQ